MIGCGHNSSGNQSRALFSNGFICSTLSKGITDSFYKEALFPGSLYMDTLSIVIEGFLWKICRFLGSYRIFCLGILLCLGSTHFLLEAVFYCLLCCLAYDSYTFVSLSLLLIIGSTIVSHNITLLIDSFFE